ncbi:MAG TPA: glutathione synthase [Myxococcales bacterium]|nr:glutathione synthase [Myxococcales bacterium]HIK85780.1 glutathione synthase [Myxococcales bacterium]
MAGAPIGWRTPASDTPAHMEFIMEPKTGSRRLLTLAFVMDPVEAEPMEGSTTIVLMREAQDRGYRVLYVDPAKLEVDAGRVLAEAVEITLALGTDEPVQRGEARVFDFDREIDVAFQRKDPPVDRDFIIATQILDICKRTIVLNRPASVIAFNEKLLAVQFADLMPATRVTQRISELRGFMAENGGQMIVKPLDGKGGEGIFHLTADDRNLSSILEQATDFGSRAIMAQQYLPAIREGDKRILLLEGEPIGAVLRVPADSETRANLHVGGRASKAPLDDADRKIISKVGPFLKDQGLFFVGIDVIGGKLTEINVTSPTGVQEINALDGVKLESLILDRVEASVDAR